MMRVWQGDEDDDDDQSSIINHHRDNAFATGIIHSTNKFIPGRKREGIITTFLFTPEFFVHP